MATFTLSKEMKAAPEAVFALMTDFSRLPKTIPEIKAVEMLTDGPAAVGTKIKETRIMFGREATETFEVTAFDPPRSFTLMANSCGVEYRVDHRFLPIESGTRFELHMTMRAISLFAKFMSPLSWMMKGMMKKPLLKDLDRLAAALESPPN